MIERTAGGPATRTRTWAPSREAGHADAGGACESGPDADHGAWSSHRGEPGASNRSGAVIVIWSELPSAVQSGVFCARAGRRGAGKGPVYVFGTSGSDGPGRGLPVARRG